MDARLMKQLVDCIDKGEEVALITVTSKLGSGPRDMGSMMIVDSRGELIGGTIGGGGVEEQAKKDAVTCIAQNLSDSFHYELTLKDSDYSLKMVCGGTVDVFIKVFKQEKQLAIFGGGHIGLVLSDFAKALGYLVSLYDIREEYCSPERFPNIDTLFTGDLDQALEQMRISPLTSIVIITHGHTYDLDVLKRVVRTDAGYIGMIGSTSKIKHCFKELLDQGVPKEVLKQVHAPIGLDIGGETPAEIALGILAEIQAIQYGKSGPFMKDIKKVLD